jgi:hypothetical protein
MLRAEVDVSDLALSGVLGVESGDFGAFSLDRRLRIGEGVCLDCREMLWLESRASLDRRLLDRDFPVLEAPTLEGDSGTESFGGTGGAGAVRSGGRGWLSFDVDDTGLRGWVSLLSLEENLDFVDKSLLSRDKENSLSCLELVKERSDTLDP